MKKLNNNIKNIIYIVIGFALLILIWELVALLINDSFLPEFFSCLYHTLLLFFDSSALLSLGYTILRLVISFLISSILGVVLGILAGYFQPLAKILSPIITFLRSLPTIAVALILTVYVPNFTLFVAAFTIFPIVYQAAEEGARSTYQKYELQILLDGKRKINNITKIILPLSLNHIILSFLQSLSLALKVEIMAETLAYKSNYYGLGKSISQLFMMVEYHKMMYYVLLAVLISLLLDGCLYFLKKHLKLNILESKKQITIIYFYVKILLSL